MKPFMSQDFLLDTPAAQELYHRYAESQPIFDYHNHLSVRDIAEHRRFRDLTELWLEHDHYKWRAMRACGIDEKYITGSALSFEKFEAWAGVVPKLVGCPLYHWTHMELQRYFGIDEPLSLQNAKSIWDRTCRMLSTEGYDAVSLLEKVNVRVLCTTDDPADTLEWHKKIREDGTIPFRVLPSFRPDKYLADPEGREAENLCEKYGTDDLCEALKKALDYFCRNGCIVSDHSFSVFPYRKNTLVSSLLCFLGACYASRGVVMQLHLGPIRNVSPRLKGLIGADAGGDSVGSMTDPYDLGSFLGDLERDAHLPRTILYNLHPADNRMLSTMAVNFAPSVQFGAAWWHNDHMRGIDDQIRELMETGALSASVGMLTDSRSMTSFVRHEYFRRILCRTLGRLVEDGSYPDDIQTLGRIVADVCYSNAARFFAFQSGF